MAEKLGCLGQLLQFILTQRAEMTHVETDNPTNYDEYKIFMAQHAKKMLRFPTTSERMDYVQQRKFEAERESNPSLKKRRLSLVGDLYEYIIINGISESAEETDKIHKLKREAWENYDNFRD